MSTANIADRYDPTAMIIKDVSPRPLSILFPLRPCFLLPPRTQKKDDHFIEQQYRTNREICDQFLIR